jgi:STAS domain
MQDEIEVIGNILFVSYRGKIVFGNEHYALSKCVRENYPDFKNVIISLEYVELRASAVPELLVDYLTAYAEGYRIRLCSASRVVRKVLESTRVIEVFQLPLDESKEESIAAFEYSYAAPHNWRAQVAAS